MRLVSRKLALQAENEDIQGLTKVLIEETGQTGLKINNAKTK